MKDAAEKTKKIAKQLSNLFTAPSRQAVQYQNEPSTKETSGFFDIRFTRFITNILIPIAWAITVTITILVALFCIGIALYSVSQGEINQQIIAAAFVVPIAGALFLLVVRVLCELIIVCVSHRNEHTQPQRNKRNTRERFGSVAVFYFHTSIMLLITPMINIYDIHQDNRLSWLRNDTETKLGVRGGRFTAVNSGLCAGIALVFG